MLNQLKNSLARTVLGKTAMGQTTQRLKKAMRLPIGYDDFGKIIDNKMKFVDKSLFIKEIIDDPAEVILITRPRHFGKTFNMSLLNYFFSEEVLDRKTQGLFDKLKIAREPGYLKKQGKIPVINLTLKDVNGENCDVLYSRLYQVIYEAHLKYADRIRSYKKLDNTSKEQFNAVLEGKASKITIQSALKNLTYCLYQCYNVKPILLIDAYDTPIQSGYLNSYYQDAISLMSHLFNSTFNDNPYLEKAVLTGILHVSKKDLFLALNNMAFYPLSAEKYSAYFGFTENEVHELLNEYELTEIELTKELKEVKNWYHGYQIGNTLVYNPWSIANYFGQNRTFEPYWANTSDNLLVKKLLIDSSVSAKEKFRWLLEGKSIDLMLDDNLNFFELRYNESALWNLFLMTGYLTFASPQSSTSEQKLLPLRIPNLEVTGVYTRFFKEWLANNQGIEWYHNFLSRLLHGNMDKFEREINEITLVITNSYDKEAFYESFMIGLTISLNKDEYRLMSNREHGDNRYTIAIIPKNTQKMGIAFVLKTGPYYEYDEDLPEVEHSEYETDMKKEGITSVCTINLIFSAKNISVVYKIEREASSSPRFSPSN